MGVAKSLTWLPEWPPPPPSPFLESIDCVSSNLGCVSHLHALLKFHLFIHVYNYRFIRYFSPIGPWALFTFFFPVFVFCLSNCVICVFHFTHSFTILLLGPSIDFLFRLFCSSVPRFPFDFPLYLLFLCGAFYFFIYFYHVCNCSLKMSFLDVYFKIFIR